MSGSVPQDGTNPVPPVPRDGRNALGATERLALIALDWHDIQCQSESPCSRHAALIVHLHLTDNCKLPGLDHNGDVVGILCSDHALAMHWDVARWMQTHLPAGPLYCRTCGKSVNEIGDIVRAAGL